MNPYNGFSGAQRDRAQRWLNEQWALGLRPRPSECCFCGQREGILQAHAEDYSEPFGDQTDRYPACYICHMMIHCRFRARAAWEQYRSMIRRGYRTVPSFTMDFGRVKRALAGGALSWIQQANPLTTSLLDTIGDPPPLEAT